MHNTQKKLHYGWLIAFAGFMVFAIDFCVIFNCVGMFVEPVTKDLGFLRRDFSLNNTVTCLAMMMVSLFSGKIYKRFKLQNVMLFGAIVCPIAYGMYSIASTKIVFYAISVVVGVGIACTGLIPVSMLMTNWFNKKRGFAIGIAFTGSGAGGIILNPLLARLIESYGWRNTYLITAVMMFVLIVPLVAFVIKSTPAEKSLDPYGGKDLFAHDSAENGITAKEAIRTLRFWMYIPFPFFISMISCSIIQLTIPFASQVGYTTQQAANFGAMSMASLAVGKILLGQIYDKKGVRFTTYSALIAFFVTMCWYSMGQNPIWLYLGVIFSGYGSALSSVAYPVIIQSLFGKKDYAGIYGYSSVAASLGTATGPFAVSLIYDMLGSYQRAWVVLSIFCLAVSVLYFMMNKFNKKEYT